MRVLIGNMVKTGVADYPCATREEAEALFMALQDRKEPARQERREREAVKANRSRRPQSARR